MSEPLRAKCTAEQVTSDHILACLELSKQDLVFNPLLTLDFFRVHRLMDLIPDSKGGCGKVSISLSIGSPRKHFRANRFGNHCRKVYIGKLFMNYLTDKV
ncbi:hypothetical protein AVEN_223327-1 [Araneus ventricosus]|uniref:Uncharacterized protein n=1 Tax=Araneus ventricosus TaxID=182803 RepID=A0A4Y2E843_ARAVE|nr:hypothetical protein AVEN_223327-1 [Araneus ventricosus]